jgi:hypothetical protein
MAENRITSKELATRRRKEQKSNASIPQTKYRPISLAELKEVALQVIRRCEGGDWTSTNPEHEGKRLKAEEVTLYDLLHYYIHLLTKERQCSYVETIANSRRKPDWFVSHWWGEPVLNFVACLEQHALDRCSNKLVRGNGRLPVATNLSQSCIGCVPTLVISIVLTRR